MNSEKTQVGVKDIINDLLYTIGAIIFVCAVVTPFCMLLNYIM
jgi:hypothetical protein